MDENTAVAFEYKQPRRYWQVRAEATRVVDGAAGNDETHDYEGNPDRLQVWSVWSMDQIDQ